jgi:DNA-binding GntR family transcriptional regulator
MQDTYYPQRMEIALNDHERIVLALLAGKVDEAAGYLSSHIHRAMGGVLSDIFHEGKEEAE